MISVNLIGTRSQNYITCLEIRNQVFVIEQKVPADEEVDEFEALSNHYLAKEGDKPVGTARWRFIDDEIIKLERFAVLQEHRGKGVGKALVAKILEDIQKQFAPSYPVLTLNSQIDAIPLYRRFGFKEEGEVFDECGILHKKMTLIL